MTPSHFKMWFDGFCAALNDELAIEDWHKIRSKMSEVHWNHTHYPCPYSWIYNGYVASPPPSTFVVPQGGIGATGPVSAMVGLSTNGSGGGGGGGCIEERVFMSQWIEEPNTNDKVLREVCQKLEQMIPSSLS